LVLDASGSATATFKSDPTKYPGSWSASGSKTGSVHLPGNYYSLTLTGSSSRLSGDSHYIDFEKAK